MGICILFSPCGHVGCSLALPHHRASTFLPPFPRSGFASRPFHRHRRHRCRVGGGALGCPRADLRPPHKLDVQFSRIQLSRRRCPLSGDGRYQPNKVDQPELAIERAARQRFPAAAPPLAEPMRPDAPHQPAVKSVEELSDVSPLVVVSPTAHDGVDLFYQLRGAHRRLASRQPANLIHEASDRFLPGIRIERSRSGTTSDLARRQPQGTAAALDLVPEKLEAVPDVDDPRLLRIDRHAQRPQDPTRHRQRGACLRRGCTGDDPIIRVPREPIAPAAHLPIERRQENVAQQRRGYPALRRPALRRKEPTLAVTARCQHRLDEAHDPAIGHTLGHEREQLFVLHRPEEVLQIRVDDPFPARFDLLPDLAQSVLRRPPSPISEVGVIEHRLEDRLQPIEQGLLTHPVVDRRDAQHAPLARLACLRDAHLPHRLRNVTVGAELLLQSGEALVELLAKRFDALAVNPSRPVIGSDALPGDLQVLPLQHLGDQRVDLPRRRRIDPVHESPRPVMFGSFAHGTFRLAGLAYLASCLSPTVFAGWLPRPPRSPGFWSRGFRRACGTTQPSDHFQGAAPPFACAYRVASLAATRGPGKFSWGLAVVFRTVPSANTLVRWVNENAFAPILRARPCPTFGRPVRPWGSPHRLRPGTSPHTLRIPPRGRHPVLRRSSSGGSRSALAVSGFRLRARLGFSIPASRSGRRGITPAFGYSAPHPSAGGTSTLLITALPSAHYAPVRLLPPVHHWLRPSGLPDAGRPATAGRSNERSPGSRARSVRTCWGLRPRRAS